MAQRIAVDSALLKWLHELSTYRNATYGGRCEHAEEGLCERCKKKLTPTKERIPGESKVSFVEVNRGN